MDLGKRTAWAGSAPLSPACRVSEASCQLAAYVSCVSEAGTTVGSGVVHAPLELDASTPCEACEGHAASWLGKPAASR